MMSFKQSTAWSNRRYVLKTLTTGSETPPSASYEEVRGLMKDALAEILNGSDHVKIMQDLKEEANRLHQDALAQLKE